VACGMHNQQIGKCWWVMMCIKSA